MKKPITLLLALLLTSVSLVAQLSDPSLAQSYLEDKATSLGLSATDVEGTIVSDHVRNTKNGAEHIYLLQTIAGVPIQGAVATVTVKDGSVVHHSHSMIENAIGKVVGSHQAQLSPAQSLDYIARHFEIKAPTISLLRTSGATEVFAASNISEREIEITPTYVQDKAGNLVLCYKTMIDAIGTSDLHHIAVSATTGAIVDYFNGAIKCQFGNRPHKHHDGYACDHTDRTFNATAAKTTSVDGAQYLAYPFPMESPYDGDRMVISEPADPRYSPFGWHDRDGVEGADVTITRGNNVLAFNSTANLTPDGGADLDFSFDLDFQEEPSEQLEPAIANLFYANNYLHDFTAWLGFDEAAGNFQEVNYTGEGRGGDFVRAEAQDPTGTNNATFGTLPEGSVSEMSMFLWDASAGGLLRIDAPEQISGLVSPTGRSYNLNGGVDWGVNLTLADQPISGDVVIASDRRNTQGCLEIETDVAGKVALVDRGGCDFSLKAARAQDAGAIGVLIVNIVGVDGGDGEETINMNGGDRAQEVEIPALFLRKSDGDRIRQQIGNGETVSVTYEEIERTGPAQIDASLDNGVIAHEFAHGISTRLTAGPNLTGCLRGVDEDNNGQADRGEQMGEGWSDFFTLISTAREGDEGEDPRAIGNYSDDQGPNGRGIRSFPYSTDMTINRSTFSNTQSVPFGDANGFAPHPVGEVWCAMLWDMYWALSDRDGYDPTLTDTTSGSYKAVRLVMDGMKLQPCNPGYEQGRDAILAADQLNYNGENQLLIWEVFARRGMGFMASSGDPLDHRDGVEDFTLPPLLIEELKITRTSDDIVAVGEEHFVEITVINHIPEAQTGVLVTDELAEGVSYVGGSTVGASEPTINGQVLTFEIGAMEYQQELTFGYSVVPDVALETVSLLYDDFEEDRGWEPLDLEGSDFTWEDDNDFGRNESNGWGVFEYEELETDQALVSPPIEIVGDLPVLRFWHRYETTRLAHGGYVGVIPEGSDFAIPLTNENFLLNGYPAEVQYGLFAIPALGGFTGDSGGDFIESYADLSDFAGQTVQIQFRFGTQETVASDIFDPAWSIDDFEMIDLESLPSTACVFSDASTDAANCAASVTIIEPSNSVDVEPVSPEDFGLEIYPNPADDYITVTAQLPTEADATIVLRSLDGREVLHTTMQIATTGSVKTVPVGSVTAGMYVLEVRTDDAVTNSRVIIY